MVNESNDGEKLASVEKKNGDDNSQSTGKTTVNDDNNKQMMNIIVKTSKERESFLVATDATVKTLREMVSQRYNVDTGKVCLIFSGKILKDDDTLEFHKMKDGYIIHLVIRDASKLAGSSTTGGGTTSATANTTSSTTTNTANNQNTTNSSQTPNSGSGSFPSFPSIDSLFGASGAPNMSSQFAQQFNNPEFIRQMLDNPLMQNLYSNPEIFRTIISSNPQFQQLIERNPELNHVLSNPEILRQTFDMMRNPAAFQELMRSHDRALSNLESLPGGYNALRRMYTELQEPMLNAAQEQFGSNPFASTNDSTSNGAVPSTTENREPLPNPWDRSQANASSTASSNTSSTTGTGAARNPFGLFGSSESMQQMMQMIGDNPNFLQNMLQNPMMQNMMQTLASNPQVTSQLFQQNLGINPPDSATLQQAMQTLSQQADNPLLQRIMTNPQALQALQQIQQGYEQLERILGVPVSNLFELIASPSAGLFRASGQGSTTTTPNMTSISNSNSTSTSATTTTTTNSNNNTTNSSSDSSTTTTTPAPQANSNNPTPSNIPNINPALLSQMMQMFNMSALSPQQRTQQPPPPVSSVAPEIQYEVQLTQLEQMGFTNRAVNLRALIESFGNVEAAIDRILSRM